MLTPSDLRLKWHTRYIEVFNMFFSYLRTIVPRMSSDTYKSQSYDEIYRSLLDGSDLVELKLTNRFLTNTFYEFIKSNNLTD